MRDFHQIDLQTYIQRLNGAYAPATIKSYYTDMRTLVDRCVRHDLNWNALSPDDVCDFLQHEAKRGMCHGTVLRRVYSARRVFTLAGISDPTNNPEVELCLRRIARARPTRPKQARGLSLAALHELLDVQPGTSWGLRNRALLSLGYDLLARRSEITALRSEDVSWRSDGTLEVILRRSKTDQSGRGRIAFTSPRSAELVGQWLEWRGGEIGPAPLLRDLSRRGDQSATLWLHGKKYHQIERAFSRVRQVGRR